MHVMIFFIPMQLDLCKAALVRVPFTYHICENFHVFDYQSVYQCAPVIPDGESQFPARDAVDRQPKHNWCCDTVN